MKRLRMIVLIGLVLVLTCVCAVALASEIILTSNSSSTTASGYKWKKDTCTLTVYAGSNSDAFNVTCNNWNLVLAGRSAYSQPITWYHDANVSCVMNITSTSTVAQRSQLCINNRGIPNSTVIVDVDSTAGAIVDLKFTSPPENFVLRRNTHVQGDVPGAGNIILQDTSYLLCKYASLNAKSFQIAPGAFIDVQNASFSISSEQSKAAEAAMQTFLKECMSPNDGVTIRFEEASGSFPDKYKFVTTGSPQPFLTAKIGAPWTVTTQPVAQPIVEGESVTLDAELSTDFGGKVTYQWQRRMNLTQPWEDLGSNETGKTLVFSDLMANSNGMQFRRVNTYTITSGNGQTFERKLYTEPATLSVSYVGTFNLDENGYDNQAANIGIFTWDKTTKTLTVLKNARATFNINVPDAKIVVTGLCDHPLFIWNNGGNSSATTLDVEMQTQTDTKLYIRSQQKAGATLRIGSTAQSGTAQPILTNGQGVENLELYGNANVTMDAQNLTRLTMKDSAYLSQSNASLVLQTLAMEPGTMISLANGNRAPLTLNNVTKAQADAFLRDFVWESEGLTMQYDDGSNGYQVCKNGALISPLTLTAPWMITTQPDNPVGAVGGSARVAVTTNIIKGVTYAWQSRASENEPWMDVGQDENLTLQNLTMDMNGSQYRCLLTQAINVGNGKTFSRQLTSETATLTVRKGPIPPQTGDNSPLALWLLGLALSITGLSAAKLRSRKLRKN